MFLLLKHLPLLQGGCFLLFEVLREAQHFYVIPPKKSATENRLCVCVCVCLCVCPILGNGHFKSYASEN